MTLSITAFRGRLKFFLKLLPFLDNEELLDLSLINVVSEEIFVKTNDNLRCASTFTFPTKLIHPPEKAGYVHI